MEPSRSASHEYLRRVGVGRKTVYNKRRMNVDMDVDVVVDVNMAMAIAIGYGNRADLRDG